MLNEIFQLCLLVVSGYTIWLVSKEQMAKAAVVGLISEFFWMGAALTAGQWSIALLTFWYSWCYWMMFKKHEQEAKEIIIKIWNYLQPWRSQY